MFVRRACAAKTILADVRTGARGRRISSRTQVVMTDNFNDAFLDIMAMRCDLRMIGTSPTAVFDGRRLKDKQDTQINAARAAKRARSASTPLSPPARTPLSLASRRLHACRPAWNPNDKHITFKLIYQLTRDESFRLPRSVFHSSLGHALAVQTRRQSSRSSPPSSSPCSSGLSRPAT